VDPIVGWATNSPDLSPIELLRIILKKLTRKIKPKMIEELSNTFTTAWSLIRQSTIDKLCKGFERRLALCLANGGESISNQLWHFSERHATKDFFEVSKGYIPWTDAEDRQLIQDWLAIGLQWKALEKK
jgi:hypothetical protein